VNKSETRIVRQAFGGGRWFPGREAELRRMVEGFLSGASAASVTGRIVAAISPHAGYVYSGPVAGHAFRAIKENAAAGNTPDVVVVLGFSHRSGFRGLALMDGDALSTPLGELTLDKVSADKMVKAGKNVRFLYDPHQGEHSAENEVPFVQAVLQKTPAVIGLFGDHDEATLNGAVLALNELAKDRKVLVVASTDLLHDADYDKVTKTDAATLRQITSLDDMALIRGWSGGNQTCCGLMPVLTAIRFARAQGASSGQLLRYRNSGDDHPESRGQWVVGYGAVVFAAFDGKRGEAK
jgi:AmmeMemoRadiSam system protein B